MLKGVIVEWGLEGVINVLDSFDAQQFGTLLKGYVLTYT